MLTPFVRNQGIATPVGGIATPVGGIATPVGGIATPTGIPGMGIQSYVSKGI